MRDREITQSGLAAAIGVSQGALSNYLSGRLPKVEELGKLADFFRVSTDEMLGRSPLHDPTPKLDSFMLRDAPSKKVIAKLEEVADNLQTQITELRQAIKELK